MNPPTELNDPARLDVSAVSCHEKHALIFRRWGELPVGGHFLLVNNHDPAGLYFVFAERFPNLFRWDYLERGPAGVVIKITRLAASTTAEAVAAAAVGCESVRRDGPALDLRDQPETDVAALLLAASQRLSAGSTVRAILSRRPGALLAPGQAQGVLQRQHEQTDGSWLVSLSRT